MDVVSLLLGAFFSSLITHLYYEKSNKKQKIVFNKLSSEVREAILKKPNDILRHEELIKILEEVKNSPVDTSRLQKPIDGGTY